MISLNVNATTHTVSEALGLLKNFLKHKVRITTLLNLSKININRLNSQLLILTMDINYMKFFTTTDNSDITILKVHHFIGILNNWAGIRTKEELILTNTYHKRTLLTSTYNLIIIALIKNGDCICANYLIKGYLYCGKQINILMFLNIFYKLNQHLSISIRYEVNAFCLEFLL